MQGSAISSHSCNFFWDCAIASHSCCLVLGKGTFGLRVADRCHVHTVVHIDVPFCFEGSHNITVIIILYALMPVENGGGGRGLLFVQWKQKLGSRFSMFAFKQHASTRNMCKKAIQRDFRKIEYNMETNREIISCKRKNDAKRYAEQVQPYQTGLS